MNFRRWNVIARALAWRKYVEESLSVHHLEVSALRTTVSASEKKTRELEEKCASLEADTADLIASIRVIWAASPNRSEQGAAIFSESLRIGLSRRGTIARLVAFPAKSDWAETIRTNLSEEIIDRASEGGVSELWIAKIDDAGVRHEWHASPDLLQRIMENPQLFRIILRAFENKPSEATRQDESGEEKFCHARDALAKDLDLIDFVSPRENSPAQSPPFHDRDHLPSYLVPAVPKKHSVVLLHNDYYHFKFLSAALKKRGWDAVSVSLVSPDSKEQQFYQGEDLNLFDPDPLQMRDRVNAFFRTIPERFGALQFYGEGVASFFAENYEYGLRNRRVPWDFFELKRHRTVIGYTPSGCLGGALQSSIRKVSNGLCDRCVWQLRPDVCSDGVNGAWIEKVEMLCDWVGLEGDWVTPEREGPRFVRDPVVKALDPDRWRPDLEVPLQFKIDKEPGELLIYHAVGNFEERQRDGRDIKGTGAVQAAITRLKEEGVPVKLFFATNIPSRDVRFFQAQADVVIDQLNYGRLGANSRESLMLGKALITSVKAGQNTPSRYLLDIPAVDASEQTVYKELKTLLSDLQRRDALKVKAREFALKWHAADVCALRFETIIEQVQGNLPLDVSNVFIKR